VQQTIVTSTTNYSYFDDKLYFVFSTSFRYGQYIYT